MINLINLKRIKDKMWIQEEKVYEKTEPVAKWLKNK